MRLKDYRNIDLEHCQINYCGNQYWWYDAPIWIFEFNVDRIEIEGDITVFYLSDK